MIGAIDVRDLVGRPGEWRSEQVSGTIDDLATELAGLPAGAPVTADLILESLDEGILASGRLQGVLSMRSGSSSFRSRTRTPMSTPSSPTASWIPIRCSATRSAWSSRSLRSAARTVGDCAVGAAAT